MESIIIESTEYINTDQGIIQAKDLKSYHTINNHPLVFEETQNIFKKIRFKGLEFFLPINKKIETDNGFIEVKSIKEGDYLKSYFLNKSHTYTIDIPFELKNNEFDLVLKENLTKFIAIACARLSFNEGIILEIRKKDTNEFLKEYEDLVLELFNKKVIKKHNKIYFFLSPLSKFLQQEIGRKSFFNKVPSIIRQAPIHLQIIFFKELIRHNSHYDNGLCVYSGASFSVAKYFNSFLKNIGYETRYNKNRSGSGKINHRIYITGYKDNPIEIEINSRSYKSIIKNKKKMDNTGINNFSIAQVKSVSLERKKAIKLYYPNELFFYNYFLLKE